MVSLSKEEQQRDRRAKMVKRGVFERGKLQVTLDAHQKLVHIIIAPSRVFKTPYFRNYILAGGKRWRPPKGG